MKLYILGNEIYYFFPHFYGEIPTGDTKATVKNQMHSAYLPLGAWSRSSTMLRQLYKPPELLFVSLKIKMPCEIGDSFGKCKHQIFISVEFIRL